MAQNYSLLLPTEPDNCWISWLLTLHLLLCECCTWITRRLKPVFHPHPYVNSGQSLTLHASFSIVPKWCSSFKMYDPKEHIYGATYHLIAQNTVLDVFSHKFFLLPFPSSLNNKILLVVPVLTLEIAFNPHYNLMSNEHKLMIFHSY